MYHAVKLRLSCVALVPEKSKFMMNELALIHIDHLTLHDPQGSLFDHKNSSEGGDTSPQMDV